MPEAIRLLREATEQSSKQGVSHNSCRRPVEWEWCSEIYARIVSNHSPVTEREYNRLVAWYERNLPGIHDANLTMLIRGYYRGARRIGATETVMRLRKLRSMNLGLE